MKVKVIQRNTFELIKQIAKGYANLEKGSRKALKTYSEVAIELVQKHMSKKEVELKEGKTYCFIYQSFENLGTARYSDYYHEINEKEMKFKRETDEYIVVNDNEVKIKKQRLICIVV